MSSDHATPPGLPTPGAQGPIDERAAQQAIEQVKDAYSRLRSEISKIIVGQDEVVDQTLMAILCRGHAVVVGVPG
ncbi:MAG: hypothetical protein KDA05_04900, partial [Phycisphaerales bacterium]|nr:hypothetical protein [Phycisphaerales bacterium]